MASPRASFLKALQRLQKTPTRGLHMTGAQASPQPINASNKPAFMAMGLQDLRDQCRKRALGASGTRHELVDKIANHDGLQARAFSIAMRRIANEQNSKRVSERPAASPSRHFNTSRALKASHDSSTIDFAYLPDLFAADFSPKTAVIRVPILPNILSDDAEARLEEYPDLEAAAGGYQGTHGGVAAIMKPQIETASQKTSAEMSHMSDVGDGHTNEMSVDTLTKLTDILGSKGQEFVEAVKGKDESTVRQIWNSLLDDMFGSKKK